MSYPRVAGHGEEERGDDDDERDDLAVVAVLEHVVELVREARQR